MEHLKRSLIDEQLNEDDVALPNGAASTFSTTIDLESVAPRKVGEVAELLVTIPDLTTTHLHRT